jgi:hypothetical protein
MIGKDFVVVIPPPETDRESFFRRILDKPE